MSWSPKYRVREVWEQIETLTDCMRRASHPVARQIFAHKRALKIPYLNAWILRLRPQDVAALCKIPRFETLCWYISEQRRRHEAAAADWCEINGGGTVTEGQMLEMKRRHPELMYRKRAA